MIHFRNIVAAVALSMMFLLNALAPANALSFSFTFSDNPLDDLLGNTHVAGTVTGRILGLVDNLNNQTPTAVFIDSHPILDVGFGPLDVFGINLITANTLSPSFADGWNVAGGVITGVDFVSNFLPNNGDTAQLRLSHSGSRNELRHRNVTGPSNQATGNLNGFSGVTFAPISPVPLPAALPLFGTGLAVMGFIGWRRKRKAA